MPLQESILSEFRIEEMSGCLLIKKKSLHGYIGNDGIFDIVRSCQGLRLRIWNPLTDWHKKGDSYNQTKKKLAL